MWSFSIFSSFLFYCFWHSRLRKQKRSDQTRLQRRLGFAQFRNLRNRLCFFGCIDFPAEWLRAVGQPPNKWVPPKDRFFFRREITKSPCVTKPHTGRKYSFYTANYKITLDYIGQIVYNIIAGTGEISMCTVSSSPYTCRRVLVTLCGCSHFCCFSMFILTYISTVVNR